jgi:prepilin-type N-terminal cleavage/methylation domain-containing protein
MANGPMANAGRLGETRENRLMRPIRTTDGIPRRGGFTLVELLVVMAIIAILASLFLGGMMVAEENARVQKTKATIAKINNIVMARWDTYRTRRVPITVGTTPPFVNYFSNTFVSGSNPIPAQTVIAAQRLDALRELMRLELPDHWSDVTQMPYGMTTSTCPVATTYLATSGNPPNLFAAQYSM